MMLSEKEPKVIGESEKRPGVLQIGIDLDGTVVDIYPLLIQAINAQFGIALDKEEITQWRLTENPKIKACPGAGDFVLGLILEEEFIYRDSLPIPGSTEAINHWRQEGHQIHFISGRSRFRSVTEKWLIAYGLDWAVQEERLHLCLEDQDTHQFKDELVKRLGINFFIDDRSQTMRVVQADSLLIKVLPEQPWNKRKRNITQTRIAKDWQEIDSLVQETSRWLYFLDQEEN